MHTQEDFEGDKMPPRTLKALVPAEESAKHLAALGLGKSEAVSVVTAAAMAGPVAQKEEEAAASVFSAATPAASEAAPAVTAAAAASVDAGATVASASLSATPSEAEAEAAATGRAEATEAVGSAAVVGPQEAAALGLTAASGDQLAFRASATKVGGAAHSHMLLVAVPASSACATCTPH